MSLENSLKSLTLSSSKSPRNVLTSNVIPSHYDLTLEPKWDDFTFEGIVDISLDIIKDTTSITLNALEIEIHKSSIASKNAQILTKPEISYDVEKQTATIEFENGTLKAGTKAELKISFTGHLNDKMNGFYRSSYEDDEGQTKYIAATQMESTECRKAFPCWDEPALKAEFSVTLISDLHHTCLSNMDIASESEITSKVTGTKRKKVVFNKSPLMSTYLIAFVVGELKCIQDDSFRVPVRFFATPDEDIESARFALELTSKTLGFYEKAFDYKYPLPKMDSVIIPDFYSGGMENWGLILYEGYILLDEEDSSISSKREVADTVMHEVAHQWFGNLVTMDWWDGLWLNEGFANWMSPYLSNKFFPQWKIWQSFVNNDYQSALELDALRSSHPVQESIIDAQDIEEIFDDISYCKGAAVLRMVAKYIGEDVFLNGVRKYIKEHAFGNTRTSDLWKALCEASGKPVDQVMNLWTTTMGFPLLTVTEDWDKGVIHIKQNRFLETGDTTTEDDRTIYPVVLGLRTNNGVDTELMLTEREASFKVDLEFYKLNADHVGLFRTCYPPERVLKLGQAAAEGKLSIEDRAGFISDMRALSSAGHKKTSELLSFLKLMSTDKDFFVWDQITDAIASVRAAWAFATPSIKQALKDFHLQLVGPKLTEIGWDFETDDEDDTLQQFKAMLFGSAADAGDERVITAAREMFTQSVEDDEDEDAIPAEILDDVYGIVIEHGGETEYDIVLDRFRDAETAEDESAAAQALGSTRDPALIERTLTLCITEIKAQDASDVLEGVSSHADAIVAMFDWMCGNWEVLVGRFGSGQNLLDRVVKACCEGLATREQLERMESFFKDKNLKGIDRTVAQALDLVRVRANWVGRDQGDLENWLRENGHLKV